MINVFVKSAELTSTEVAQITSVVTEQLNVEIDKKDTTIMFVTKKGLGLNSEKIDIPEQGRIAAGVRGILLGEEDVVVSASQVQKGENIVLVSNNSYAKQINTSEIEVSARYRKGVKVFDLKGEKSSGDSVLCAGRFGESDEIVVESTEKDLSAIPISSINEDTRSSRGQSLSVERFKPILMSVIKKNSD